MCLPELTSDALGIKGTYKRDGTRSHEILARILDGPSHAWPLVAKGAY